MVRLLDTRKERDERQSNRGQRATQRASAAHQDYSVNFWRSMAVGESGFLDELSD